MAVRSSTRRVRRGAICRPIQPPSPRSAGMSESRRMFAALPGIGLRELDVIADGQVLNFMLQHRAGHFDVLMIRQDGR